MVARSLWTNFRDSLWLAQQINVTGLDPWYTGVLNVALVNELDKENEKKARDLSPDSPPLFLISSSLPLSNLFLSIFVADTPPRDVTDLYRTPCRLTELTSDLLSKVFFLYCLREKREREREGGVSEGKIRFDGSSFREWNGMEIEPLKYQRNFTRMKLLTRI